MEDEKKNVFSMIDDIFQLTTIPKHALSKLVDITNCCICNAVEESSLARELVTEIQLGIGTLLVSQEENTLAYKFIPAPALEKALIKTVLEGKNPLTYKLESTLVTRITKTYKDLF